MNLAVTATQGGFTPEQFQAAYSYLEWTFEDISAFHHGGCIGGDDRLQWMIAQLKEELSAGLRSHPGGVCSPRVIMHRGSTPDKWALGCDDNADEIREPRDNIERNHIMVDETDQLLACPSGKNEVTRSGTWATMRYARRMKKPVVIIFPDGSRDAW